MFRLNVLPSDLDLHLRDYIVPSASPPVLEALYYSYLTSCPSLEVYLFSVICAIAVPPLILLLPRCRDLIISARLSYFCLMSEGLSKRKTQSRVIDKACLCFPLLYYFSVFPAFEICLSSSVYGSHATHYRTSPLSQPYHHRAVNVGPLFMRRWFYR